VGDGGSAFAHASACGGAGEDPHEESPEEGDVQYAQAEATYDELERGGDASVAMQSGFYSMFSGGGYTDSLVTASGGKVEGGCELAPGSRAVYAFHNPGVAKLDEDGARPRPRRADAWRTHPAAARAVSKLAQLPAGRGQLHLNVGLICCGVSTAGKRLGFGPIFGLQSPYAVPLKFLDSSGNIVQDYTTANFYHILRLLDAPHGDRVTLITMECSAGWELMPLRDVGSGARQDAPLVPFGVRGQASRSSRPLTPRRWSRASRCSPPSSPSSSAAAGTSPTAPWRACAEGACAACWCWRPSGTSPPTTTRAAPSSPLATSAAACASACSAPPAATARRRPAPRSWSACASC